MQVFSIATVSNSVILCQRVGSFDENLGLKLDDEAYKIVLNTACTPKKVPKELRALYEYINDPSKSESSTLVKAIDERVKKFNGRDWRWRQVTLEYMMMEEYRKGLAEGEAKMAERLNKLNLLLKEAGRMDDLFRSLEEPVYQQQLLEEFGL